MAGATHNVLRAVLLLGILIVGMVGFATPPAAHAHGGPFELSVSTDGVGGLIVTANYTEDSHVVSEIMDLTATATSPDGEVLGPTGFISAAEGEGVWVTKEPFIPVGTWSVTVKTATPQAVSKTIEIQVEEPGEPIVAQTADPVSAGAGDDATVAAWAWGGGILVALVVVVGGWFGIRRRKLAVKSPAGPQVQGR